MRSIRPIMFRGRTLDTKEFVIGDLIHRGERAFILNEDGEKEVEPITVGESIGIVDKTGVLIFEDDTICCGDILNFPIYCVVDYQENEARFLFYGNGDWYPIDNWDEDELLVIGNAFMDKKELESIMEEF